jgi:hypothetical protein
MDTLEGAPTEQKEEWILAEQERLDEAVSLQSVYEQQYINDEITLEEYIEKNDEYIYALAQQQAFDALLEKRAYFQETDEAVCYFYDLEILQFYKNSGTDYILIMLICFAIAITYDLDNGLDMHRLMLTMPRGRASFWRCKFAAALLAGGSAAALGGVLDIILYGVRYGCAYMDMPAYSMEQMSRAAFAMPVWGSFVLLLLAKIVIGVMMAAVVSLLSMLIQKWMMTVFIAVICFCIPALLSDYMPRWVLCLLQPNQMVNSGMGLYLLIDVGIVLGVWGYLPKEAKRFR